MLRYVVATLSALALATLALATPAAACAAAAPVSRPLSHPSLRLSSARPMAKQESAQTATYRVRSGDTLSSIAKKTYGAARQWPRLWWANRHHIKNPNLIRIGQELAIRGRSHTLAWETDRALAAIPSPAVRPRASDSATPTPRPVLVSDTHASDPAPRHAPRATETAVPGSFEACVIQAESGGDASAYNPTSGASGLFGFLLSTWDSLGLGYPGGAYTAPASVQMQGFQIEYSRAGTAPWAPYDGC